VFGYWLERYWFQEVAYQFAGIALIGADGVQGPGQSIIIPDRSVVTPPAVVEEG